MSPAQTTAVSRPSATGQTVRLEAILRTEELWCRSRRAADYETDRHVIGRLVEALAQSPSSILQVLADTVHNVFRAGSAGLSLLNPEGDQFYWAAIAGQWKPHIGGGTPRNFGPCGDVLDRGAPLLFTHWERRYPYLAEATPLAEEGLLVPFYVDRKAVGTIWAIAHDDQRKFDLEDLRQLETFGRFASAAYQAAVLFRADETCRAAIDAMKAANMAHQEIARLTNLLSTARNNVAA